MAGHAVYVGKDYSAATKESSWFLESYQQVEGGWQLERVGSAVGEIMIWWAEGG